MSKHTNRQQKALTGAVMRTQSEADTWRTPTTIKLTIRTTEELQQARVAAYKTII